ncbi:hypothetical protein G7B40_024075 [Aetokthonos hydrillicola Thurmond2011]|jgi:hypothetical protein|uniref:Uncharacterized protein n=1 Tax=Aetokthonos hydrillicola Thurmond2011 TaxID=2712845 RepID=A0AAP5M705_9CYAN|nr:hypothetical protein [Aetokthonos hydrillicola]MBO3461135.1 hypothetical protein [Aetokthonos hydrillicola CCALA 1050]MBW4586904.1 hypothetical protein [Aetokthonos hydrillicola CCALA 1050]MDR9897621.1 hypothetical protein [Aetokthonos hydrillicola Thurmond2011]
MVRLLEKRKATVSLLGTFAIATLGLHLFTLFLLIFQGFTIRKLSLQKIPTFVQLVDGKQVTNINNLERDNEAIRQFVSKTMTSMFNWTGTLPPQTIEQVTNPTQDPGINITTPQGTRKVTTSSWVASFGLSEDFRKGFLAEVGNMTPPEVFSNIPSQAISGQLIIKRVYPPKPIEPGKWEVGIVANIIQKKRFEDKTIVTPFNKDLLVRAVDTFSYPNDTSTELQKAIYSVRSEKIEIYEMRNLCLLDQYEKPNGQQFPICGNTQNNFNQ